MTDSVPAADARVLIHRALGVPDVVGEEARDEIAAELLMRSIPELSELPMERVRDTVMPFIDWFADELKRGGFGRLLVGLPFQGHDPVEVVASTMPQGLFWEYAISKPLADRLLEVVKDFVAEFPFYDDNHRPFRPRPDIGELADG